MPEYLAPGVFVEEIDGGSKPIEGVGTNTAAFVGYAKSGPFNTPIFISNWSQFCATFGEPENAYVKALAEQTGQSKGQIVSSKRAARKSWPEYGRNLVEKSLKEKADTLTVGSWPAFLSKYEADGITSNTPYMEEAYLAYSVRGYYDNGGGRAYVVRVARPEDIEALSEPRASRKAVGEARNATLALGGATLRALKAGPEGNDIKVEVTPVGDKDDFRLKISHGDTVEEFPSAPGEGGDINRISDLMNQHSKLLRSEMAPKGAKPQTATATRPKVGTFTFEGGLNAPSGNAEIVPVSGAAASILKDVEAGDFIGDEMKRSGARGLSTLEEVNMVVAPDLMAGLFKRNISVEEDRYGRKNVIIEAEELDREVLAERQAAILAAQCELVGYCEISGDRMAILDPIPGQTPQEMMDTTLSTPYNCDHGQAAIYYPWIKVNDPLHKGQQRFVPPSGHIAGVWTRVGVERGVHKAPANEAIIGAIAMEQLVTKGEQEILNPIGVNCIRSFPGTGIRVWGARTLATVGNPSWKYVNVRRLFNYLEKSMERGLQWVVFEPNDHDLWGRVRRNLSAFLWTEWKEGKLFGTSPSEAFYVKCDAETNSQEMIDLGRLYVEIGINPVKPAEFVIVRMGQWSGGGAMSEA